MELLIEAAQVVAAMAGLWIIGYLWCGYLYWDMHHKKGGRQHG